MDIIRLTYPFDIAPDAPDLALAIGFFDGVHEGHREVIRRAVELAEPRQLTPAILTFDPHPREVLLNQRLQYITPLTDKLERFAACGAERTYVLTFDRRLSQLTPEQFVSEVLIPLKTAVVTVGFNFTYGHLGRGNAEMLRELAGERMLVSIVRPFHIDGVRVSSTMIREKLLAGEVDRAAELIGRPYSLSGIVAKGHGRGRTIGVPTANLQLSESYLIPKTGVYAVYATVDGNRFGAVMNIGYKPTFGDAEAEPTLEAHLFDFNRDIYGRRIRVEFVARLRGEQKFGSADELAAQIRRDIGKAKEILAFTS